MKKTSWKKRALAAALICAMLYTATGCSTAAPGVASQAPVSSPASSQAESSAAPASSQQEASSQAVSSSVPSESQSAVSSVASSEGSASTEVNIEDAEVPSSAKPVLTHVLVPEASGKVTYTSSGATLDASNAAKGYVMIKYTGDGSKIKVRVTKSGGTDYTYNLDVSDSYSVFPLTEGNGKYTISVLKNKSGTTYVQVLGQVIDVSLENSLLPFLYPNQYVNFSDSSAAVKKAAELAANASNDAGTVSQIYNYVINNVTYDTAKANSVSSGYLPNVDNVLSTKKGICFDYAALMTAMLRSQNIPTKLVVGNTGELYHAWINVYLDDVGWVDNIIYFDGKNWTLMDPTFASSGKGDASIQKYIGDGTNYKAKFTY